MSRRAAFFDLPKTRIDIPTPLLAAMDEGLPKAIPFLPDVVVEHNEGVLVSGMDGEMLWLDSTLEATGSVNTPYPMRIRHASISHGHLYATWLDRELMYACMASIPVGSELNGPTRAELRTSLGKPMTPHPPGTGWSHSLDAEPMALQSNDTELVFVLYRRGIYSVGLDASEHWRMATPTWNYLKKRPRNEEIIALHLKEDHFHVTSRGGRIQSRALHNGHLIEEFLLEGVEGPIEHHFAYGNHNLVCTTAGEVSWLDGDQLVHRVQLSGPVQHARWDGVVGGWRIAGWREEIVLNTERYDRRETREIPVHVFLKDDNALLLYNDGSWEYSPLRL